MHTQTRFADPCAVHFGPGTRVNLPEAATTELFRHSVRRKFAVGEVLFHAGDRGDVLFLVCEGRVGLRSVSPDGHAVVADSVGPGGLLGVHAVFDGEARHPVTAVAMTPTLTRAVNREAVLGLGYTSMAVVVALGRMLAEDVSTLHRRNVEATWLRADERVRRHLVELFERFGERVGDGQLQITTTHDEIAELAGVARPTASLVLQDGVRRGVVVTSRRRVTATSLVALKRWAEQ